MFHGREINRKINHIHERSLRIVFRDYNSSFKDLLKKDNYVCIHHRNIQSLAVESFKKKENLSNTIMSDIFPITVLNYNLRSQTDLLRNTVNTTKFGLNSLKHFASKVWSMTPIEIKNSSTAETFKSKIRKWEPNDCDCKLCQDYLHEIGYVNLLNVLTESSRIPEILLYINWRDVVNIFSCVSVPEHASEGFFKFNYLSILLFYCLYLIYLILGYYILCTFNLFYRF